MSFARTPESRAAEHCHQKRHAHVKPVAHLPEIGRPRIAIEACRNFADPWHGVQQRHIVACPRHVFRRHRIVEIDVDRAWDPFLLNPGDVENVGIGDYIIKIAIFGVPVPAVFLRQAKFSELPKGPKLGDEDTPYEQVADFYRFWQNLRSWRTFDLLTEHDAAEAQDREERRWMQRQNKNVTDRIKRDEYKRVMAFVQLAYENDPRVIANREMLAAAKLAVKAAKEDALAQEKAARDAVANAAAEGERQKQAVAEVAKAAQSETKATEKREKERLRSLLKKARKELKTLAEAGRWAARAADIEVLAATLSVEELQALSAALGAATTPDTIAAMEAKLTADVAALVAQ